MNLENISKRIIDFIFDTEEVSTKKTCVYYYVLQMILESIISTSITLLFAIIFDKMIETLFFLIFFIMLRIYVGGLHLNKFWQCCLLSNLVIFFGVFIAEKTELNLYVIGFTIFLIMMLFNYVKKTCDYKERQFFLKRLKRCIIFILGIVFSFVMLRHYYIINVLFSSVLMITLACIAQWIKEIKGGEKNERLNN